MCDHVRVPLRALTLLLLLYRMYRRLPSSQRRKLNAAASRHGLRLARRHGPRVAESVARRARRRP